MGITTESVKRCYQAKNLFELHLNDIAEWLKISDKETEGMEFEDIKKKVSSVINNDLYRTRNGKKVANPAAIFKRVRGKKRKDGKYSYKSGVYKLANSSNPSLGKTNNDGPLDKGDDVLASIVNSYIGKGGEFAVASELIFRQYNINLVSVDDGIDLVGFKDGKLFLIQVKTTSLKEDNKLQVLFNPKSFDRYDDRSVYYIIVIRGIDKRNIHINQYLIFSTDVITRFSYSGLINTQGRAWTMKFSQHDGDIFIYNGNKEESVKYYLNNFNLIK